MTDKLKQIETKIQLLQKKKEKIRIQQALSFVKEVQKILLNEFSPEAALRVLSETWNSSQKSQKEEWKKQEDSFREKSSQESCKKTDAIPSADNKSQKAKIQTHE